MVAVPGMTEAGTGDTSVCRSLRVAFLGAFHGSFGALLSGFSEGISGLWPLGLSRL